MDSIRSAIEEHWRASERGDIEVEHAIYAEEAILDAVFSPAGDRALVVLLARPGDIVAQEHWCSSGFANTDLDLLLKRQGIHQLIMMGLIAHTCLEATVRFGAELGYEVTVVRDATASYSDEEMHAALEINIPNYATAILSAEEALEAISTSTT